jgi:hypothetical protein
MTAPHDGIVGVGMMGREHAHGIAHLDGPP